MFDKIYGDFHVFPQFAFNKIKTELDYYYQKVNP